MATHREQLEHGTLRSYVKRNAGAGKRCRREQHRYWRHWGKQNLEDKPMYNRYVGWEL